MYRSHLINFRLSLALLLLLLILIAGCAAHRPLPANSVAITDLKPTVILISFDAFRSDYLQRGSLPNLTKLAADGVRSEALMPVFPTKTFPNHYSIVTGLYPEHHGLISNRMYDPEYQQYFRADQDMGDGRWWGGEPLWITAELQGQHSATFFWPGSEAEIKGHRPSYWKSYDKYLDYHERIAQVMRWLELPAATRPTFITIYFEVVDLAGHDYGPDSSQVTAAIHTADQLVGEIIDSLKARQIFDSTNLIIVSDHGMAAISPSRVIKLEQYLEPSQARILEDSPLGWIWPAAGQEEAVYNKLVNAHPNLKVYRREELPKHYHSGHHRRISPIIAVADEGWVIGTKSIDDGGLHGYDPALASMQGIFIAHGPAFKRHLIVPAFPNIDIYNIVTKILKLKPAANDGCLECPQRMLKEQ